MATKVFKGWLPKDYNLKESDVLQLFYDIETERGLKADWPPKEWPPMKVTVTVETED